jgi:hypothetical protein
MFYEEEQCPGHTATVNFIEIVRRRRIRDVNVNYPVVSRQFSLTNVDWSVSKNDVIHNGL